MIRGIRVFIPIGTLTLLVSEIMLVTSAFILATYFELSVDPTVFLLDDGGLFRISLVLVSILLGLHFHDLYSQFYVKSRIVLMQQLCLVMGVAFLTQGLIATGFFPPMVTGMIATGEQTGDLDSMLDKVAEYYENESTHAALQLVVILGVVLLLIVAVLVFMKVASFYMGLYGGLSGAG